MLKSFISENFTYNKLTEAEQNQRGILGRLKGIIADTNASTRNNRIYSKQLWENVFNNDVIKEKIENRCFFGELGHPTDREEVDPEKIAICLAEQPKISDDGKIYGVFDILATPNGKILKTLCDYGCNIGVSSRGTGDIIDGPNGDEVDPDTYVCECWDAVLIPAVKEARMEYVTESLKNKPSLRVALNESMKRAKPEDRKIMKETISKLKLNESIFGDYKEFDGWNQEDIDLWKSTDWAARNYQDLPVETDTFNGVAHAYGLDNNKDTETTFIKYLRANPVFGPYYAPKENPYMDYSVLGPMYDGEDQGPYGIHNRYETQELYDRLSEEKECNDSDCEDEKECDNKKILVETEPKDDYLTEEDEYSEEETDNVDSVGEESDVDTDTSEEEVADSESEEDEEDSDELVAEFQEALKKSRSLLSDNLKLREEITVCNAKEKHFREEVRKYKAATTRLSEEVKKTSKLKDDLKTLNTELDKNADLLESNQKEINKLNQLNKRLHEKLNNNKSIMSDNKSEISNLQNQISRLTEELEEKSKQLDNSKKLNERYKVISKNYRDAYIEVKATNFGLKKEDIIKNLKESYSIKDIDSKCEELSRYKRNISKLPFTLNESTKFEAKPSREPIKGENAMLSDDFISDGLLNLADLK